MMASVLRHNSIVTVLILKLQVISNQWVSNQSRETPLITDLLITFVVTPETFPSEKHD